MKEKTVCSANEIKNVGSFKKTDCLIVRLLIFTAC